MPGLRQGERQQDFSKEAVVTALQRVLESKTFSQSTSLRDTLAFIVRNSFSPSREPIKEYSIATEVLGRTRDFDPKADPIVRVQLHRLREKLGEYYSTDGKQEQIRIVIPRGQYTAEYTTNVAAPEQSTQPSPQPLETPQVTRKRASWPWAAIFALVVCSLILLVNVLSRKRREPSRALPSSLALLWEPFLSPSDPPLIVYANPAFLVSTRGNFYLYDRPMILSMPMGSRVPRLGNQDAAAAHGEEKGPFYYFDAYTGSGELVAAARIAQFLTSHGEPFLIKRSRIVSYEDVKNQNVVFLGGTGQDLILRKLPLPLELVFVLAPPDQVPMGSYIQDLNPPPGHPATYKLQLDPSTGAIQIEYGLVSLVPGVSGTHDVLILAGITTLGTQAAADFAISDQDMASLERMWMPTKTPKSRYFQAVLQTQVRDGVPLDAKCLMFRNLNERVR